jgi:hypothetical protein
MPEGSGVTDRGNPGRSPSQAPAPLHTRKRPDRERSYNGVFIMLDSHGATCNRDPQLENIAAELTSAVYPLVLRHGLRVSWLDLELGLWRALAETVKKVGREASLPPSV